MSPYQNPRRDRLSKGVLSHCVEFIVLPDIKSNVSETRRSAVIAALVNGRLLASRKGRGKLRLVARRCSELPPLSSSLPAAKNRNPRCVSLKLNRLLDIHSIPSELRSGASFSWHAGFGRCVRDTCKYDRLRQTHSGKRTKTAKKSFSSNAVFQSSAGTRGSSKLDEADNKIYDAGGRAFCDGDLGLASPLLSILEDKSIKFKQNLPCRRCCGLSSLVVTYELEQPVRRYESGDSVKPLPPNRVSKEHSRMYKAAFEFAKAHGYDFVLFNDVDRKKLSVNGQQETACHKSLDRKKPAMRLPLARKVSSEKRPAHVIDLESMGDIRVLSLHTLELGVKNIEVTDSVTIDTANGVDITNSPNEMGAVETTATGRWGKKFDDDKVENRFLDYSVVKESPSPFDEYEIYLRDASREVCGQRAGVSEKVARSERGRSVNVPDDHVTPCRFIIAGEDSGLSKTESVLPRLSEKTSKAYKLCNSISAAVSRETRLALGTGGVKRTSSTSEIIMDFKRDERKANQGCGRKESSQCNNTVTTPRGTDLLEVLCTLHSQSYDRQSYRAGNCNNNALPEMQLSLDDLRNDVSFTEDDDDDERRREPRRSREVSHGGCKINQDDNTAYQNNTKFHGRIKLPVLLNNCNRQKRSKTKHEDCVSSIPPLISAKSSKNASTIRAGRQRKKHRCETESNSFVGEEMHGERKPIDSKGLCGKKRPTRLSSVVVKESYNVSNDTNVHRNIQGLNTNMVSAAHGTGGVNDNLLKSDQAIFQIGCFNSEKINSLMPGVFSSSFDGEEEHKFISKQTTDQYTHENCETSSQKDTFKQIAVLKTLENPISSKKPPERIVASVKVRENRLLPSLPLSDNHRRTSNVNQVDAVRPVTADNNVNGGPAVNANNSSTQSDHKPTSCKKKRTAVDIERPTFTRRACNTETSESNECHGQFNLSHNANLRGRKRADHGLCASGNGLSRCQDRFIQDLNLELHALVEDHFKPMRYICSDINTSNTTKSGRYYRNLHEENNGRGIRFGHVVNHRPARNIKTCSGIQVSGDPDFPEQNVASNYSNFSAEDQYSSPIPGEDETPDQQYNDMKLFLNMAYDRNYPPNFASKDGAVLCPTTENYWQTAAQDRPQQLFHTQTPASWQKDEYVTNCCRNGQNSVFSNYCPQPVTEDPMEFEESSQGDTYPPALLNIYRQLIETLQLSHGLFSEKLETMKHSFYQDLQSLRSLVETKYDRACAYIATGNVGELTSRESSVCHEQQVNNDNHDRSDEANVTVNQMTCQAPPFLSNSERMPEFLTDQTASASNSKVKTVSSKKVAISTMNILKPASHSSSARYRTRQTERTYLRRLPNRRFKEKDTNTSRQQGRECKRVGSRKENKPLKAQSNTAGGKVVTRYRSNQHSRACRRRHAADGICCNLCLQKPPTALSYQPARRAARKINARKRSLRGRRSSRVARTSILKNKKGKAMSSPKEVKRRKSLRRNYSRSDSSSDIGANRTFNNIGRGSFKPHVAGFANRNQNSRPTYKNEKKKRSNGVKKGSKIVKAKSVYTITRKGERALYRNLQTRYKHLLKYVNDLKNGALSYKKTKNKGSDPQNLSIRFRHLVTHFPVQKLQALENMIEKYEGIIYRYRGHGVNASGGSPVQPPKFNSKTPKASLKRKNIAEEHQSLNDGENNRFWSQRNNSFQKSKMPGRERKKKSSHSPRPVDSLLLARRRLVGQRNHSRNARLVTLIEPEALRSSQLADRKNALFSPIHDASEDSLHGEVSVSSPCSSCESLTNPCMLNPLFLLGGSYPQPGQDVHAPAPDAGASRRNEDRQNLLLLRMNAFRQCYLDASRGVSQKLSPFKSLVSDSRFSCSDEQLENASQQHVCCNNSLPPTLLQRGRGMSLPNTPPQPCSPRRVHDLFPFSFSSPFTNRDAPDSVKPSCRAECLNNAFQQIQSDKVTENISPSLNVRLPGALSEPSPNSDREKIVSQLPCSINEQQFTIPHISSSKSMLNSSGPPFPNSTSAHPIPGGSKSHVFHQNQSQNIHDQMSDNENLVKSLFSHFEAESRSQNTQPVQENHVKSQFSHSLWAGFTSRSSEKATKKSHLFCSDEKLNLGSTESHDVPLYDNQCNSNESPNGSSVKHSLQDVSKKVSCELKSMAQTTTSAMRPDVNGNTNETNLKGNAPTTSSQVQSCDITNNSVRCYQSSPTNQDGQAKEPDTQEQNDEAVWKRVQPYLVVNPPGICTTWKCYYGPGEILSTTCSSKTSSTSTRQNTSINDVAISDRTNRCASQSPSEVHTEESKDRSKTLEFDTKETSVQEETSSDENVNDNARNLAMSWAGSTINCTDQMKRDYLSFVGKSLYDSSIPTSPFVKSTQVRVNSFNPFVNLSHSGDVHSPCASHFELSAVKETKRNNDEFIHRSAVNLSSVADYPHVPSMEKGELCSNMNLPIGALEVSNTQPESSTRNLSLQKNSKQYPYRQLLSNRKRHLKADTKAPICKRPRLNSRILTGQLSHAQRISRCLRRSRFQIMRELRYMNERQAEKQKRPDESPVVQSLRKAKVERNGESSDADSEFSV
ncbi:hypothetical protein Btru_026519 [Bulinus truncatus]|nr:hypothetical protein Btru_026519 [Bulinus truncatus]